MGEMVCGAKRFGGGWGGGVGNGIGHCGMGVEVGAGGPVSVLGKRQGRKRPGRNDLVGWGDGAGAKSSVTD